MSLKIPANRYFYNNLFQLWQMLYTKIYKADSAGIN